MDNSRLVKIYTEAGRLFDSKGYSDTKMAEIAKASGIAVGTMYSMFTGKEAVLSFVLQATLDKSYFDREIELPIKAINVSILLNQLKDIMNRAEEILTITNEAGIVCKDFLTLMEEIFDYFADYLLALTVIEKHAGVLEELNQEYYPAKNQYFAKLEECLNLYMREGQIVQVDYIFSHVIFLNNTLSWWAINANLSLSQMIPRNIAKETCLGIIERAYRP